MSPDTAVTGTYTIHGWALSFTSGLLTAIAPPPEGVGGCTLCGVPVTLGAAAGPVMFAPAGAGGEPPASVYVANVPPPGDDVRRPIPPAKDCP